ncbi:MDR family MFS transporter [Streptomyces uncialis]|uniref:MDR family MFS transporter n=1 Tax=Streptomyces uncialis TaxID=1048205 RepID=UPI00364D0653
MKTTSRLSSVTGGGAGVLRDLRALGSVTRLLILSGFAFNLGFFLVLPYLAEHLGGTLGLAAWLVGLVLGLRTFSQQGLFVVGGALTDRYGARRVMLAGCVLRIAGFGWLAFAHSTWSVIGSVLLVGFAAALYAPALETEIARQAVRHEQTDKVARTRTLGLFLMGGQAGALIGPIAGTALLAGGFRAACLAGAVVFAVILVALHRLLPAPEPRTAPEPVAASTSARSGVGELLRNRRFLALCLAYGSYLLAYNQLYLALPMELERTTGSQVALGWMLALSSLMVVLGQLPLSGRVAGAMSHAAAVRWGLLLITGAFTAAGALPPLAGGLLPSLVFVVLLTVGQMLVIPGVRAWLPDLADDRRLGLYTGALSSVSGVVVLLGSAPTGALLDTGGGLSWFALAAVPLIGLSLVPRHRD